MSKKLREFLAAYLAWVDEGAPRRDCIPLFSRGYGLCYNAKLYVPDDDHTVWYEAAQALRDEMAALFKRDGLDKDYPFCTEVQYDTMSYSNTHHKCEARIEWIRKQLEASC